MPEIKEITLTHRQWETIRCALLCHAVDVNHGWTPRQDSAWADEIKTAYILLKNQLEAV